MHIIQHITETKASAEQLLRPPQVPCQIRGLQEPLHDNKVVHTKLPHIAKPVLFSQKSN